MKRFFLISILLATVIIPTRCAKAPRARQGVRKTVIQMTLFVTVWGLALKYFYMSLPD